ncbi:hypothetical protein AURDEDRAFT_171070 [Auricularia subglabra TFB-10046 SS5]|nr:hypothetical protein AURDEDRAFT_171070 [Auricularia subglabra TFB-10046 SS5]
MPDFALSVAILMVALLLIHVGMKAAKMWSLAVHLSFAAVNTLVAVLTAFGLLATIWFQVSGSVCGAPVLSALLRCPIPGPSLQSRSTGSRSPPLLADPVVACNIFGATYPVTLSHSMSGYMPTLSLTSNLANNLSLWAPLSAHHHHTLVTLKMLPPRLEEATSGLNDLLSQSERTFELAEATLFLWEKRVFAASTRLTVASVFFRVLGRASDFNQPYLSHFPAEVLHGLDSSLRLLTEITSDAIASLNFQKHVIAQLHDAYATTSQVAWEEEFLASDSMRRRWLPPSASEKAQLELRREVRLHSSLATCALEFVLDALRGVSSALHTIRHLQGHTDAIHRRQGAPAEHQVTWTTAADYRATTDWTPPDDAATSFSSREDNASSKPPSARDAHLRHALPWVLPAVPFESSHRGGAILTTGHGLQHEALVL